MGIKKGQIKSGSLRMDSHLRSTTAFSVRTFIFTVTQTFRMVGCYDICPQHACCTEFCNFKEIVGTDTEIKFYLLRYQGGRQSGFSQLVHVFITPGKRITQFLGNISTCIIQ